MKNKIIEGIRQILIRTYLPIQKKKNEWLSNFHFSISFRISVNYMKLFLLYGAIFLIGFSILYLYDGSKPYGEMEQQFLERLTKEGTWDETICEEYRTQGIEIRIFGDEEEVLYDNTGFAPSNRKFLFGRFYYSTVNDDYIMVVRLHRDVTLQGVTYPVLIQYNLTKEYNQLLDLLWKVAILYLILAFYINKRGKKENVKLLQPIGEMSRLANSLNVDNLCSERINVAGTKNELKDLAVLINKMLDRMETSYESQKQFVSDASHELRTPIAVIQGYGNMLHRWGSKDEEVLKESIEAINNEAKSMQDLVEKLLFLSRHDKKTLKLDKKKFNMEPVVEELLKETKLVAKDRTIVCPTLEKVIVYGDPQALKQAIRVFVDNAIKYTKEGDTISISCKNVHGDCMIAIEDTGIGMTKKDMDHIFQRFYRSDVVRNQNISGHGLGLSLAKLIILAHVGRIKVRSQFTVGTSFFITIPLRNR